LAQFRQGNLFASGAANGPEHGNLADDLRPELPESLDRNRPVVGPVGDCLDDLDLCGGR
jgi:hypothetical protein